MFGEVATAVMSGLAWPPLWPCEAGAAASHASTMVAVLSSCQGRPALTGAVEAVCRMCELQNQQAIWLQCGCDAPEAAHGTSLLHEMVEGAHQHE